MEIRTVRVCKHCKDLEERFPEQFYPGSGAHRQHVCGADSWISVSVDDPFVQRRMVQDNMVIPT